MDAMDEIHTANEYNVNNVAFEAAPSAPEPEVELRKKPKPPPKKHKLEKQATRYSLDSNPPMFYDRGMKGVRWYDRILLDRRLRFAIVFVLFAVITPLIIYATVFTADSRVDPYDIPGTCILRPEYRVPCNPGSNSSQQQCSNIGCCWNKTTSECHHSAPSSYQYYIQGSPNVDTAPEIQLNMKPRLGNSVFGTPAVQTLKVNIQALAEDHLQVTIIKDSKQTSATYAASRNIQTSQFNVTVYKPSFFLDVSRDDGSGGAHLLLSTAHGPLIASDNYWEVSLQMPRDAQVFGLGRLLLSSDVDNPKVMYNHPRSTGTHPVLICIDSEGRAHGIFLQHSGPLETHFSQDANLLILRSISTEGFNIHVFAGPTPRDVVTQLTGLLGRPVLPPYWSLGLHVCMDRADNSSDPTNGTIIAESWANFSASATEMGLPFDSHCLHERLLADLALRVAVEDEAVIKEALEELRSGGRRFMISLPPALNVSEENAAYTAALEKGALLQRSSTNSSPYQGELWGSTVVYPDWSHAEALPWITAQLQALQVQLGLFEGVVLQDNWPTDETTHSHERLPYIPKVMNGSLSNGTVWWKATQADGLQHYTAHNSYGLEQTRAVRESLAAVDELLLLSASTAAGSGSVAGGHHQGAADVPAKWAALKEALSYVLGSGLVGLPLASGGPVCGNMEDYDPKDDEALCLKWYLLASTLPLIRVSSVYPYRDPTSLFSGYARQAVLRALRLRYSLLPYFYTLFHEASQSGAPVVRPMFFEFPEDNRTFALEEQFLLGAGLMVAPVVLPNSIRVQVYLPNENVTWYEFQGGGSVNNGTGGRYITLDNWETEMLMLVRGGYVIPMQAANLTADSSRLSPHAFIVGLHCLNIDQCNATGRLYLDMKDQNVTLPVDADQSAVRISNLRAAAFLCPQSGDPPTVSTVVDGVRVFGLNTTHAQIAVSVNGQPRDDVTVDYRERDLTLRLEGLAVDLCQLGTDDLDISWT